MSDDYSDSEAEAEARAMAEAMGFTDFGGPSKKKRKFNPRADATSASSPPPEEPSYTGANNMPLGERRRVPLPPPAKNDRPMNLPAPRYAEEHEDKCRGRGVGGTGAGAGAVVRGGSGNEDEITLDDDDDDEEEGEVKEGDTASTGPQYIDTSRPPRPLSPSEAEAREMQERINAILARIDAPDDPAAPSEVPGAADGASLLPPKPVAPGNNHWSGETTTTNRQHQHSRREPGGKPWWEGYLDPKFNENPWERLEKEKGLEARGGWVPRGTTTAGKGR